MRFNHFHELYWLALPVFCDNGIQINCPSLVVGRGSVVGESWRTEDNVENVVEAMKFM